MNVSDELWMWLHQKYKMSRIVRKLYSIKTNNCSYLAVPNSGRLNQWNNKCEWWSTNVITSKIWYESNHKTIYIQTEQNNYLTLLFPKISNWINETMDVIDEVWMWIHQNYGMNWILKIVFSWDKKNELAFMPVSNLCLDVGYVFTKS